MGLILIAVPLVACDHDDHPPIPKPQQSTAAQAPSTLAAPIPLALKRGIQQAFIKRRDQFSACVSQARTSGAIQAAKVSDAHLKFSLDLEILSVGREVVLRDVQPTWHAEIAQPARECILTVVPTELTLDEPIQYHGRTTYPMCLGFKELLTSTQMGLDS